MRVQVNLNDEIVEKIDAKAKSYGVTRSALLAVWIGQILAGLDTVDKAAYGAIQSTADSVDV